MSCTIGSPYRPAQSVRVPLETGSLPRPQMVWLGTEPEASPRSYELRQAVSEFSRHGLTRRLL